MKASVCRCVTRVALLFVFVSFGLVSLVFADALSEKSGQQEAESRSPWIMVGLTPEGCGGGCRRLFSVIKEISGNPNGIMLNFNRVTLEFVMETKPEFVVLSPQGTPWCRYTGEKGIALQNFLWILPVMAETMNIPILGVCGGHQALALAFGGKVGPIRAGEDDCMPYTRDRQTGLVPLLLNFADPIFSGISGELQIVESHYDEVKVLPPGFVLLASEKISPFQIIRHPTRPVYGIQGHPESMYSRGSNGCKLIRNFLKIALDYNSSERQSQQGRRGLLTLQRPDAHNAGN